MRQPTLFGYLRPGSEPPRWDLKDLYSSDLDPAMEQDRQSCIRAAREFESDYEGQVHRLDARGMCEALSRLERIGELEARIRSWAELRFAADTGDNEAGRLLGLARTLSSEIASTVLFFLLEWSDQPEEHAGTMLSDPCLERYRHALARARRAHRHRLSPREERVIERLAPVGTRSWAALSDKVTGAMRFGAQGKVLPEVLKDFSSAHREVRRGAAAMLGTGLPPHLPVLTHALNTVAEGHRITSGMRRFRHWLGERALQDEVTPETIETTAGLVHEHFDLAARYYRVKAAVLGLDVLEDFDRTAPVGQLPGEPYTWDRAREIVRASFEALSPDLGRVAGLFLERPWIDAAVRPGKRAGAFCHPTTPRVHPYIMMSFGGTASDLLTLAHEMGHGIHQYLSRGQSPLASIPLPMAEMSALLGELLVFERLAGQHGGRQLLITRCLQVERIMATTFRQISLHRFERRVHQAVGSQGPLASEAVGRLFLESQKELYGESIRFSEGHEHWWAIVPHFVHTPGYVYAYALAQLLVLAMFRKLSGAAGQGAEQVVHFLAQGGSRSPEELLAPLGLDPSGPETLRAGLSVVEHLLEGLERGAGEIGGTR